MISLRKRRVLLLEIIFQLSLKIRERLHCPVWERNDRKHEVIFVYRSANYHWSIVPIINPVGHLVPNAPQMVLLVYLVRSAFKHQYSPYVCVVSSN